MLVCHHDLEPVFVDRTDREMCFGMCISCVINVCFCAHSVCSFVGKQKSSYAGDQFLYVEFMYVLMYSVYVIPCRRCVVIYSVYVHSLCCSDPHMPDISCRMFVH